jgi:hypothetical protein
MCSYGIQAQRQNAATTLCDVKFVGSLATSDPLSPTAEYNCWDTFRIHFTTAGLDIEPNSEAIKIFYSVNEGSWRRLPTEVMFFQNYLGWWRPLPDDQQPEEDIHGGYRIISATACDVNAGYEFISSELSPRSIFAGEDIRNNVRFQVQLERNSNADIYPSADLNNAEAVLGGAVLATEDCIGQSTNPYGISDCKCDGYACALCLHGSLKKGSYTGHALEPITLKVSFRAWSRDNAARNIQSMDLYAIKRRGYHTRRVYIKEAVYLGPSGAWITGDSEYQTCDNMQLCTGRETDKGPVFESQPVTLLDLFAVYAKDPDYDPELDELSLGFKATNCTHSVQSCKEGWTYPNHAGEFEIDVKIYTDLTNTGASISKSVIPRQRE